MKILIACLLLLTAICRAEEPSPAPAPFHLNVQVSYSGAKAHPDLAAFIYKSLRELPGVGIVDEDPDATIFIGENSHGNQYACTLILLTSPAFEINLAISGAAFSDDVERHYEHPPEKGVKEDKPTWQRSLEGDLKNLPAMYYFKGGWVSMGDSPKPALLKLIQKVDLEYVEKQRRDYQYLLTHPFKAEKPSAPTLPPVSISAEIPDLMLGPDPFPKK